MADGPYVLDQRQQQAGLAALQATGSVISGGSTVNAGAGFNRGMYFGGMEPGSPGSSVYMGPNTKVMAPGLIAGGVGVAGSFLNKNTMDYEKASGLPATWSEKEKRDFVSKGILYGMPGFDYNMGMPEIMKAWGDMVDSSQVLSKSGGGDWSPWDVMESYRKGDDWGTIRKGDWLYDARTNEKVKYVGPKSKTTTSKNVNLSSPEDVKALTTQMLTELLGRAPTTEELARYRSSINGYEEANPEITTTTTTYDDMGEPVNQSSKTTGGASQAALGSIVSEGAKKGPEYGKYQSGTTYFNALMAMISGG